MSEEVHQPKTVIYRTDIVEHLEAVMGVLDFDQNFDNEFSKFKLAINFVSETMENIRNGVIPLADKDRMDLLPRPEPIYKMDRIWNGTTYLGIVKDVNGLSVLKREIFYEMPDRYFKVRGNNGKIMDYPRDIIELPKLKRMVPVQQIKLDTWGIQVRTTWDIQYAWEGSQYGTIIEDGKFKYMTETGEVAKFEPHEMNEELNKTNILSRPVYQEVTDILSYWMNENLFKFISDVQKIRDWMRVDDRMNAQHDDDDDTSDDDDFVV